MREPKFKNFQIIVKMSKVEIITRIKNMNDISISLVKLVENTTYVICLSRMFLRLENKIISMTIIVEEIDVNLCKLTISMQSSFSEGVFSDFNSGKSLRLELLKQFDTQVIEVKEINTEEIV